MSSSPFPVASLTPKSEIGATDFLSNHPEYDGRNVVIAVFDTGVDPGAIGLQVTSTGARKIVDMVDCTGDGDVDTSTVITSESRSIVGKSGRKLTLGADWRNPSKKWYIGAKRAFELFPSSLVSRLKEEQKKKFLEKNAAAIAKAQSELSAWKAENASPTGEKKRTEEELTQRVTSLTEISDNFSYDGPIFDCVVFFDGESWRAVVDTTFSGDLSELKPMRAYKEDFEYRSFGHESMLNFSVNIYDEGKLLSIVVDSGSHGTHVAGIAAAFHPEDPQANGIAPGAQILSVKIGDNRIKSMETGSALIRGLQAVRVAKADVINLSFGEAATLPNVGRFIELATELVNQDGVIFLSSAGNDGPAMSTVGAPGGTSTAIIGVGACVTPAMMEAEYSMHQQNPATQYTWSSRGPSVDGGLGVAISAPGGAVTCVPNWNLEKSMLMNGTSMASPNAAGGVALVLSGLKQENIPYTAHSVRRALENSAVPAANLELFTQGHGLVQVGGAFEYAKKHHTAKGEQLLFEVTVPSREARGVYLREAHETRSPYAVSVFVKPEFHEEENNAKKVEFEMRCVLECDAPWVKFPQFLDLLAGGRSFEIVVDGGSLGPGAHSTKIVGRDADSVGRGAVFEVPVFVVKPLSLQPTDEAVVRFPSLHLSETTVERKFIEVPKGATWVEVSVRAGALQKQHGVMLHCVQLVPHRPRDAIHMRHLMHVRSFEREVRKMDVIGGYTLEVCLAHHWNSLGSLSVELEVAFFGVKTVENAIHTSSQRILSLSVQTPLRRVTMQPSVTLSSLSKTLRPKSSTISLLGERDKLTKGRVVASLVLQYKFSVDVAGTFSVRPADLHALLYDSPFDSQLAVVLDDNKQILFWSDAKHTYSGSLTKGDHSIQFCLRHDRVDLLTKYKNLPLVLSRTISSDDVSAITAYPTLPDALLEKEKFGVQKVAKGSTTMIYFTAPTEKLPKDAKPGDYLQGRIKLVKGEDSVGSIPVSFTVLPEAEKDKEDDEENGDETEEDKLKKQIDQQRVKSLAALRKKAGIALRGGVGSPTDAQKSAATSFWKILQDGFSQNENDLPLLLEALRAVSTDVGKIKDDSRDVLDLFRWEESESNLATIISAADKIIRVIDANALAAFYGFKSDDSDSEQKAKKKKLDKEKDALIETLNTKSLALSSFVGNERYRVLFIETTKDLRRWVEPSDAKYVRVLALAESVQDRPGKAIKFLSTVISSKDAIASKELFLTRMNIFYKLGWTHIVEQQWNEFEKRFPSTKPSFA